MRFSSAKASSKVSFKERAFCHLASLAQVQMPSWLVMLLVMGLAVMLSGCFSARQQYGYDQNAVHLAKTRAAMVTQGLPAYDPITTSALPSGQTSGWSPHFYPGTGVKPGQNDVQSQPFTPKGIQSTAGMPPKPSVASVDLPAPPLPLPESTAAPSTTLFGRGGVGRQTGFSARGSNFGGTALGGMPKFHQPAYNTSLKVFPNPVPQPQPGFRVANASASSSPLPYPNITRQSNVPVTPVQNTQRLQVFNNPVPPVARQQVVKPRQPVIQPPVQQIMRAPTQPVYRQPYSGPVQPTYQQAQPSFNMTKNMGAYAPRPVPKGANLVVNSNGYQVDTGDELNIRVLGEKDLTGRYQVDSTGAITMPMISTVNVRGRTVSQISNIIQNRLRQGFLRTPSVSVEVISARPFFILGQVKKPGKYNYVNGLSVSQAIAIAGGYEARARKGVVRVTRQTPQGPVTAEVPNEELLMPGDTIYVKQRWF